MGILAAREISRFKGIGLCETTSVVSISKYRLFLPPSFPFFDPYPIEETILLLFRPRDPGYFVTAGPSRSSPSSFSFPPPSRRNNSALSRTRVERVDENKDLRGVFSTIRSIVKGNLKRKRRRRDNVSRDGQMGPDRWKSWKRYDRDRYHD